MLHAEIQVPSTWIWKYSLFYFLKFNNRPGQCNQVYENRHHGWQHLENKRAVPKHKNGRDHGNIKCPWFSPADTAEADHEKNSGEDEQVSVDQQPDQLLLKRATLAQYKDIVKDSIDQA